MIQIKVAFVMPCSIGIMTIDLETAVRTLVCVAMGQHPSRRVSVGLIVAVLARKFSDFPETHLVELVTRTVLEEGGTVDLAVPSDATAPLRPPA